MNGAELNAIKEVLRAELGEALAALELRLASRYADVAVEREVDELARWRSFTKGALAALSLVGTVAAVAAGLALKVAVGA